MVSNESAWFCSRLPLSANRSLISLVFLFLFYRTNKQARMSCMFKKKGLTLSSMAELDISVNLQIKLPGGATMVNWSLMSLFGFAVGSPFSPNRSTR